MLYSDMTEFIENNKNMSMLQANYNVGITGLYLKQMKLDLAWDSLEKARVSMAGKSYSFDAGYCYNLAEYQFLTGDEPAAIEQTKYLLSLDLYSNIISLAPLLKYMLKTGRMDGPLTDKYISDYLGTAVKSRTLDSQILYARILFRTGDTVCPMSITDDVLANARKNDIKLKIVEAALFKISILITSAGEKREILNLFKEAVFYAYDDLVFLPFFYELETVKLIHSKYAHDTSTLLSDEENGFLQAVFKLADKNKNELLSERELEVLNELAAGYANKEIGDRLCISLSTVKTHIINIYGKLQVNSRLSAVDEAKKLGLI